MKYILEFADTNDKLLAKIKKQFVIVEVELDYDNPFHGKITQSVLLISIMSLDDIVKLSNLCQIIISSQHWQHINYPSIEMYNGYIE